MSDELDATGALLPDEYRLAQTGRRLRSMSLDELPSLWNVLRGEMSLVGPRPLPTRYLRRYDERQLKRLDVKPGLTGLAQVNGRNSLTWEEKFGYDIAYVDAISFRGDLQIVAQTVAAVIQRHGIDREDGSAMPEFGV